MEQGEALRLELLYAEPYPLFRRCHDIVRFSFTIVCNIVIRFAFHQSWLRES
jgi:hypothetical protein